MKSIVIHDTRKKSVLNRHPWIYSGSVKSADRKIINGETVRVTAEDGQFLCYGLYNAASKITVRAFCWEENTVPDENYIRKLAIDAVRKRAGILSRKNTDCCRLVYSESDFLPGIIADYYNGFISASFNTASAQLFKNIISETLMSETKAAGLVECSSEDFLKKEGISSFKILKSGEIPSEIIISENGIQYETDIIYGQKTGFYADQRENRAIIGEMTSGKTVLDAFCYTGGFTLNSLEHGAKHVTSLDSSIPALERLQKSLELNMYSKDRQTSVQGDAFQTLRNMVTENKIFDFIILDPPKLAPNRHALNDALRAYKELNLSAMKLISNGGLIAVFSCSQAVSIETLKEVIRWASIDAGKNALIMRYLSQPEDHPVLAAFPESEYLKGIIYSVI